MFGVGEGEEEMKAKGRGRERKREGGLKKRNPSLGTHTHRLSVQCEAQKKPVTPPDSF